MLLITSAWKPRVRAITVAANVVTLLFIPHSLVDCNSIVSVRKFDPLGWLKALESEDSSPGSAIGRGVTWILSVRISRPIEGSQVAPMYRLVKGALRSTL